MARESLIQKSLKKQKYSTRNYNRCRECGRPRGYMGDFMLCRICFRKHALLGEIPGIRKASW